MQTDPAVEAYFAELPAERQEPMQQLREAIRANLPPGFEETMTSGMPGYVVPLAAFPAGYHTTPGEPLPLIAIGSTKSAIAVYHMGVYADEDLLDWFRGAYADLAIGRLDIGKSCIRFRNPKKIPYALLGELASKVTPADWVATYEGMREGR